MAFVLFMTIIVILVLLTLFTLILTSGQVHQLSKPDGLMQGETAIVVLLACHCGQLKPIQVVQYVHHR